MKFITTAAFIGFMSLGVGAESGFVDLEKIDEVFDNFSREDTGLWPIPKEFPIEKPVLGGQVHASHIGVAHFEGPEKAFDAELKTKYLADTKGLKLKFQSNEDPLSIAGYAICSGNDFPGRDPMDWILSGSTDGEKWQVLDKRSGEVFSKRHERRLFKLNAPASYSGYKLEVTKNNGASMTQLAELEFLAAKEVDALSTSVAWEPLFSDDLSNAVYPDGIWTVEHGELTASEDQMIYSKQEYENFVLDLEFKNGPAANSGVFIYLTDPKAWVQNSVEIQIADDWADKWANQNPTWKCGAVFGRLAASEQTVKPAGEWNRYTLICRGPYLDVLLNGVHVNSMDMRQWDSPTHNPDGTKKPGWLSKPLSNHPTKGRIGFQGKHGGAPIWFRNIRVKQLH